MDLGPRPVRFRPLWYDLQRTVCRWQQFGQIVVFSAGHLQQEFRAAQYRGLPTPILWIVDYFVIDGEGFRYGRFYRTAGWYSHILLWTAFGCWLISNILFRTVVHYGAYFLGISGILQLIANLVWYVVRNPNPLVIPFEDDIIRTKYGPSFWLNFSNGIVCCLLALIILLMEYKFSDMIYTFFGIDPLDSYEKLVYLSKRNFLFEIVVFLRFHF